jgi:NADH:ubiquinone reductase (H+-translocating)
VTVGAGFSGVETVAEVRELVRRSLKYYSNIRPEEVRFYIIEYAGRILPTFPADLAEYATRRPQLHGIQVLTGVGTKAATGTEVELTDGRIIPTSTIVAAIGNSPHPLVATLDLDMTWPGCYGAASICRSCPASRRSSGSASTGSSTA